MSLYEKIISKQAKIAIIGLGYVGMPLAVAFAKKAEVIGFDLNNGWIQIKNLNQFLSKSFVVEKSNIPLVVARNSYVKSAPKFDERFNRQLVKKGEELNATARVMNGNWYILQDGSFINTNVTEIK